MVRSRSANLACHPERSRARLYASRGVEGSAVRVFRHLACLLLLLAPAVRAQQDSGDTFHIESKLVNLFVNVTDQTGAVVGGLTRDDFKVAEDGRPQQIAVFERQSELPLNLILSIDTSGSVYKDREQEREASKKFIHALLRPQDQMGLIEFSTYVTLLVPFTNKVSQLDRGLGALKGGEATALYDAIYLGSDSLARKQGRKVLVLVSDGGDTVKDKTYAEALEQALRDEVTIYSVIDVPIEASAGRDIGGEHALITLAEQTGGKSFYVESGNLDKAFAKVSEDLRTQYLIAYYPHNQAPGLSFHRINVTVPRAAAESFNVRYKTGYYTDSPEKPKRRVPVD
ncbi:MAG TPA: VWA domain-containing protein [Terracidiphilus sp.]|jgi:Ca-activated chloride channel family protein|nr:VWA domain-containing protein [Terracidiphilus sp.]